MTGCPDNLLRYDPPLDLLNERVILVTGAAGSLGGAAACAYAMYGAVTVLIDKDQHGIQQTYDAIIQRRCCAPVLVQQDLATASVALCEQLANEVANELGRLDGILHCAAELGALAPLHLNEMDAWSRVCRVNLLAPYLLTRACLPLLLNSHDASVIFTSSDVARHGRAYWGAYGVSGAATEALVKIWSDEIEQHDNLRMNSLDPGPVASHLRSQAYPGEDPCRLRTAEDICPACLYLMGPASRGIRGQQLTVPAI